MKIEGLYDIQSYTENGVTKLLLVHREQKEKKYTIIDNFLPYCFVELPIDIHIEWNDSKAQLVGNKIDNGGTINRKSGRVFFSTIEPFGKTLANCLQITLDFV